MAQAVSGERTIMIDSQINDGIAVLTMSHGKANALDIEFCDALAMRVSELRGSDVKAVVLTGQGKIFSAGVNLKRLSEGGADYIRRFLPALHRLYDTVFFHPQPVIAAINGHAIAGGAVLACCADRRIMARDSGRIGVTEILVGVPFPALAFEIVRFAVPPRYLSEFTLSGATYETAAALQRGWIDEVAVPDELLNNAVAVARELAMLSPSAFAQTKSQIRQLVAERLQRGGDATDKAVTEIWTAPATLTYIRDYVARTLNKA
jgi:enoyl-CoA hydratase